MPGGVGLGHGLVVNAGGQVEQGQALRGVKDKHRLILRVDDGEARRKSFEHGDRGGLVVDEDATLAVGGDVTAENDLSGGGVEAVGFEDGGDGGVGGLVNGADSSLLRAVADDVRLGSLAEEEGESTIRMDLPAPVSPVSRLRPAPNSTTTLSMTA